MNSIIFLTLLGTVLLCVSNATKSDVDTGACVFDKYNRDHELKAVEKIRGLVGKTFTSEDIEGKWHFTVGICANLQMDGADSDAGAIQKLIDPEDKKIHTIGSLKNTHLMAGKDWALLQYKDGESYTSHCGKEPKRTVVMLTCDESVDTENAKMVYIEEESEKEGDCYYLFEMRHQAVCPKASASVLSVGSILLISFFTVLGIYLLIGFLYQRFVLGSKGIEQIPNYEFWKDLGNLEADGCDFVCRTRGRQNTGFRGIGDDQLDATDEIRDDNLLPM